MSDPEENTFSMIGATDKFLDDNATVLVDKIPALAGHMLDIKDLMGEVRRLNLESIRPLTGFTLNEANIRSIMMDNAITTGGGLEAHFKSVNDVIREAQVRLTDSQLMAARGDNVVPFCELVVEMADPYDPGMGGYGITQPRIGELEGSIANFLANMHRGRAAVAVRSSAGRKIPKVLKAILTILYLIDDAMKTIRTSHDELYNAWEIVRITIDLHGGTPIPVTAHRELLPGEILVLASVAYDPERRIKFHNLHPTESILIGLSSITNAYSNPPRVLLADSYSTLLSSTLAPDGDYILFQNTSSVPITVEITLLD